MNDVMLRHRPPPSGVLAIGTTCPSSAPSGPTLSGPTWASLLKGQVSLSGATPQVVTSSGGSPTTAAALNPAYAGKDFCQELPAAREPGTAVYTMAVGRPEVLLGGLVVRADVRVAGDFPVLVGRLWDVDPTTGTRQLVEAGVVRPNINQTRSATPSSTGSGRLELQLSPNEYTVPAGHELELELVGSTAPWFRPSNGSYRITVSHLTATLTTG